MDQNEISTTEYLKQWPHLHEIADDIPEFDGDVPIGILIGVNSPTAFRSIKVVKRANNDPFAQKTSLGWCIMGPISKYKHSSKVVRCNRIAVVDKSDCHVASRHFVVDRTVPETDCKQMLLDMYEQEFSEQGPKKMKNMVMLIATFLHLKIYHCQRKIIIKISGQDGKSSH